MQKTIAITSKVNSTLATSADYKIVYNYDKESDPLNLAPTTSALVVLAIGDALAVSLSMHKNFKKKISMSSTQVAVLVKV